MIEIEFTDSYVIKGNRLSVRISNTQVFEYRQLQIEVFDVGVANPSPRLGFGTTPTRLEGQVVQVEIDSQHLPIGIYEIRLIRLHDPIDSNLVPQVDFTPRRDFTRQLFEVVASPESHRSASALLTQVQQREAELERQFLLPVDICQPGTSIASEYCVFVFVRDVLIGTSIRFRNFELVPTQSGLDSRDPLDFVNWFLRERTLTKLQFVYEDVMAERSRQSSPVCVVHFPTMVSSSIEEVRDYCIEQTGKLLLALSLSRDAGGIAFEVVVLDRRMYNATKFSISPSYVGNLLTGQLSGETVESLETYLGGLARDPINGFLVGLYREARRDRSPDFQYVRFWQILETMAESENYDPISPLLDYENNVLMDGNQPRQSKGSVNIVFRLLRDTGIGSTNETWKKVNVWFAFRNAVAHHGSVARYPELSRATVKAWAELGHNEIVKAAGHDNFLWALKEDTKLLLMRRLVGNAGGV
ncbi:MAG: hypothetical protein ABL911_01010 [Gallionella sp.]|nr:hypothetical protein [Gallionella sp.]